MTSHGRSSDAHFKHNNRDPIYYHMRKKY